MQETLVGRFDPELDALAAVTPMQALRAVRLQLRIVPPGGPLPDSPLLEPVGAGVFQELVLWLHKEVVPLADEHIGRFGGPELLWEKALASRANVRISDDVAMVTREGGSFRAITATTPFLAARVLQPNHPTWWGYPARNSLFGILAVMPAGNAVGVHVIQDGRAPASIPALAAFARLRARVTPDSMSTDVFWVHEQGIERVASWQGSDTLDLTGSPEFTKLMVDLAQVGHIQPDRPAARPRWYESPSPTPEDEYLAGAWGDDEYDRGPWPEER